MNETINGNDMEEKKRGPNYRGLFVLGISFIALGTSFIPMREKLGSLGIVFIALGGLFMMFAVKHKEKWQEKK